MTPVQAGTILVQEPMAVSLANGVSSESDLGFALFSEFAFLSDPHIWFFDPPPRV
jgi:hypothetical protein